MGNMGLALLMATATVKASSCLDVAVAKIPPCAQPCFLDNDPSAECDGTDFTCRCQKEAILYAAIEPCVASGCPEESFQVVIDGASSVCDCETAFPGALAVENALGSFTGVPAVTASNTVLNTVIGAVPGTVTNAVAGSAIGTVIGTVINSPTTTDATSAPALATSSLSQSGAPRYRNDLWFNLVTNIAIPVLLTVLL
ncbi:hypothetical protein F4820DRAFT_151618 [Hypoxylon rubiginosum]|uniref:Uncharacterized protein n=1 Tax=Hypoxylon rubiginosum TaxID=110542 RepID=A0ACB9Z8N4_9PEZI|nr:hypothetical protein F4820DRAFT_151618 [Hypoxylon rubiginosum]